MKRDEATNMKTSIERTVRQGERGIALALALFAMAAMMVGATSALFVGADDIRASRNYRGAAQAHFAAESGLTHALQTINSVGVIDFKNEIVDEWGNNWFGATAQNFPIAGYSYTLTPVEDATNPSQLGWIRSTAVGAENVRNVVVARVQQANIPGTAPGAIYLANNSPTNSSFQGNAFTVNGNDYNTDGTLKAGGVSMPGIATRTQANTNETIGSLSGGQLDNVQGLGFQAGPPVVTSVQTAPTGANVAQLNALVDSLIAQPGVNTYSTSKINNSNKASFQSPACGIGCCTGGANNPKISHFTAADLEAKFNGNITGCGVMIVDGNIDIQGTIDFLGLIIVRGATTISTDSETGITGNATVYGSLWTSNLNLDVGGSSIVRYSTQALAFANSVMPTGAFPAPLNVLGLVNCTQVPAGTAGCPS
jgi:hypothetical protein